MRRPFAWYHDNEAWWRPLKERLAVQEGAWGRDKNGFTTEAQRIHREIGMD